MKKTKRMTALFLSLIMVFSLVTGVGTVKVQAAKLNEEDITIEGEEELTRDSLVIMNSLKWEWDNEKGRDLIESVNYEDGAYTGTGLVPGEERTVFIGRFSNTDKKVGAVGGDNDFTIKKIVYGDKEQEIDVTDESITITPADSKMFSDPEMAAGFFTIKTTKDAGYNDYRLYIDDDETTTTAPLNINTYEPTEGFYKKVPNPNDLTEGYIYDGSGERFQWSETKRSLYFIYKVWPETRWDDKAQKEYNFRKNIPAKLTWDESDKRYDYSENAKVSLYVDRDGTREPVTDKKYASIEEINTVSIEGYKVFAVTLGDDYDGCGLFVPLLNEYYKSDGTKDEETGSTDAWLNCEEKREGLGIDWWISEEEKASDDGRKEYTDIKKNREDWVNLSPSQYALFYGDELTTAHSAKVQFENEQAENVEVKDGMIEYTFNRFGTYTISVGEGALNTVRVTTGPAPVGFYNAVSTIPTVADATDDTKFIHSDRIKVVSGREAKVYFYVNSELESEGEHFVYASFYDGFYKWDDEAKKDVEVEAVKCSMEKIGTTGWYEITIPSDIKGAERLELQAEAKAGESAEENEGRHLTVDFVAAGQYGLVGVDGVDSCEPYDANLGDICDMLQFSNTHDMTFKIIQYGSNDNSLEAATSVVNVDASKLKFVYRDNEEPYEHDDALGKYVEIVSNRNGNITIHSDYEYTHGGYDVVYDGEYVGRISIPQAGTGLYETSHATRPSDREGAVKTNYFKEGAIAYKEKQPGKAYTFNVFSWCWDGQSQADFENDYGVEAPLLTPQVAKGIILDCKKTGIPEGDDPVFSKISLFCNQNDLGSFKLTAINDKGQDVTDKYITVADIKDPDNDSLIVGKKVTVSDKVAEGFTINVSVESNATVIDRLLKADKEEWPGGPNVWTWANGSKDEVSYDVKFTPFTGIKITSTPSKVSYTEGDKLDTTGIAVAGVYADGTTYPLTAADFTVSPAAALTTADKKATVTYKNLTASYDITVAAKQETPAPTPTPTPTPAPAEVGQNITSADPTVTGEFKVTDKADGTGNGAVTYEGEAEGSTAEKVVIPEKITAPDGKTYDVTEVADNALKGNTTVKEVVVSDKIIKIGANAFQGAKKLKKATLGKKVSKISANAFRDCANLKEVTFKNKGALTIGANVFKGDKKLKSVTIKGKVKSVGKNAFKDVSKKCVINVKASKKEFKNVKKLIKKSGAKNLKIKRI